MRAYQDDVFRICLRIVRDRDDAESVTQEVFLQVWKKISQYDERLSFRPWLLTVAHNVAVNELRRLSRNPSPLLEQTVGDEFSGTADVRDEARGKSPRRFESPFEGVWKTEQLALVQQALAELPELQRRCLSLQCYGRRSYKQIADDVGRSVPSVKMALSRARRRLRSKLRSLIEPEASERSP